MKHRQIGRYLIKAELKRGGMSTVYLAHDPLFERDVAIKLLPQEMLDKPTLRARFDREARIVASLDHPAIVPVYDFGEKEEQPYIVLRFMLGGSLEDMLHQGPLSLSATAHIIQRLALALDEVHTKGIVHRDLKPSNILFDQRHEAFISDFGIVRLNIAGARLTSTGDAIGTPAYMSPEQIRGDRMLDRRSDIYALGVILFEMLAGKHPYDTQTPMGVAVKHITAPVPPIHHFQPDLPPEIQVILAKAMAKEPDDRYQTAGEMAEAVQMLLAQPVPVKVEMGVALRPDTAPVLLLDGPERTNGHRGGNGYGLVAAANHHRQLCSLPHLGPSPTLQFLAPLGFVFTPALYGRWFCPDQPITGGTFAHTDRIVGGLCHSYANRDGDSYEHRYSHCRPHRFTNYDINGNAGSHVDPHVDPHDYPDIYPDYGNGNGRGRVLFRSRQ